MSKRAERAQSRRHIQIFDEDWEYLDKRYMYPGPMVRQILHLAVKQLRQAEIARADRTGGQTMEDISKQQLGELADD